MSNNDKYVIDTHSYRSTMRVELFSTLILLLGVLASCTSSSADNNKEITNIICHSDEICKDNYNEQSWLGEQRRDLVSNLIMASGVSHTQIPDAIKIDEYQFDHIHSIKVEVVWMSGLSHSIHNYAYQLLDTNQEQAIELADLIVSKEIPLLKQSIRIKLKDYIVANRTQGWNFTPQTEEETTSWLDKNIDNIFTHYGTINRVNNEVVLTYCTSNFAQSNAFYSCVNVPAKNYLEYKYL